jgi:hypothetical protein
VKNLGTKRGRFSDAENATICALAERGLKPGQIAVRLDRHPASVNWAMTRLGLKAPSVRYFSYMRVGKMVCSFSPEEDAFIERAQTSGKLNKREIGELCELRFGHRRTSSTVRTRLIMIANRAEAAAT